MDIFSTPETSSPRLASLVSTMMADDRVGNHQAECVGGAGAVAIKVYDNGAIEDHPAGDTESREGLVRGLLSRGLIAMTRNGRWMAIEQIWDVFKHPYMDCIYFTRPSERGELFCTLEDHSKTKTCAEK
jgi:hypothetical protein